MIYLLTGANRDVGIGHGLLTALLQQPDNTIIACVGDPASASAASLPSLPKASTTKLIFMKLDPFSTSDPADVVATLSNVHAITRIDVVLAMPGQEGHIGHGCSTAMGRLMDHFAINTLAPLVLFQSVAPLLRCAPDGGGKFVVITSNGSADGDNEHDSFQFSAYGSSKAAANYVVRKIHFENDWLTSFIVHPGWIDTSSGEIIAREGEHQVPTVQQSAASILQLVNSSTREKTSGHILVI